VARDRERRAGPRGLAGRPAVAHDLRRGPPGGVVEEVLRGERHEVRALRDLAVVVEGQAVAAEQGATERRAPLRHHALEEVPGEQAQAPTVHDASAPSVVRGIAHLAATQEPEGYWLAAPVMAAGGARTYFDPRGFASAAAVVASLATTRTIRRAATTADRRTASACSTPFQ